MIATTPHHREKITTSNEVTKLQSNASIPSLNTHLQSGFLPTNKIKWFQARSLFKQDLSSVGKQNKEECWHSQKFQNRHAGDSDKRVTESDQKCE